MKPHDYSGLNDAQCLHVDLFAERLRHYRHQPVADAVRFRLTRREAQARYPLTESEAAAMDDYVAGRFEVRKAEGRGPAGLPVPLTVVN